MTLRLGAATIGVADPGPVARFWAGLLDRTVVPEGRGMLLPAAPGQLPLRFAVDPRPWFDADRWHLHVGGDKTGDQVRLVARALDLGAVHLDVGQLPREEHVVLADPSGGALCVLKSGNSFVAGCGRLGELACEGTRQVGVFWSQALGWPLVWDQNEETAIQSPCGGTKLAWGGPPIESKTVVNRQRFEVFVDHNDLADELDRLRGLGAEPLGAHPDGAYDLADPDGNEFYLLLR